MSDLVEAWLKSGKHAEIAGLRLRPIEYPQLKGILLATSRGQAQAFYLTDDNGLDWILKKFLPAKTPDPAYINAIGSLIPRWPGFQSGSRRQILSKSSLSKSGFFSADFGSWLENTVLMPRVSSDDWAKLADKIRNGSVRLTEDDRMLLCKSLSQQINLLERNDLSHRDLSVTNVFVDWQAQFVHLIDWDCIFHPSLAMPPNTTFGTDGYVAPFVKVSGSPDPRVTWRPRADRFSLAILNAEFLSMDFGTPDMNDGGMFDQSELFNRGGLETARIINNLQNHFPRAASLLEKALRAQSFDDCPSPADWLALSNPMPMPSLNLASTFAPGSTSQPNDAPQANLNSFALLDEAAFVCLDERAFVPLV